MKKILLAAALLLFLGAGCAGKKTASDGQKPVTGAAPHSPMAMLDRIAIDGLKTGDVLASGPAQAKGNWKTEDFVPFHLQLTFKVPTTKTGTLVFRKDNPSGLPENEDEMDMPVSFKAEVLPPCKPTGCTGEVCADTEIKTACSVSDENACYKKAACERQNDGQCGWTQDKPLTECLKAAAEKAKEEKKP